MEFARTRKKAREVSLIPLIDVAMFLLIFFMVAGSIQKFDIVPVDPPKAQSGKLVDEGTIQIVLGKRDELVLDDDLISMDELQPKIQALLASNPDKIITVKADSSIPAVRMIQVMDSIKLAGGKNLSIATQSETVHAAPKR